VMREKQPYATISGTRTLVATGMSNTGRHSYKVQSSEARQDVDRSCRHSRAGVTLD